MQLFINNVVATATCSHDTICHMTQLPHPTNVCHYRDIKGARHVYKLRLQQETRYSKAGKAEVINPKGWVGEGLLGGAELPPHQPGVMRSTVSSPNTTNTFAALGHLRWNLLAICCITKVTIYHTVLSITQKWGLCFSPRNLCQWTRASVWRPQPNLTVEQNAESSSTSSSSSSSSSN